MMKYQIIFRFIGLTLAMNIAPSLAQDSNSVIELQSGHLKGWLVAPKQSPSQRDIKEGLKLLSDAKLANLKSNDLDLQRLEIIEQDNNKGLILKAEIPLGNRGVQPIHFELNEPLTASLGKERVLIDKKSGKKELQHKLEIRSRNEPLIAIQEVGSKVIGHKMVLLWTQSQEPTQQKTLRGIRLIEIVQDSRKAERQILLVDARF